MTTIHERYLFQSHRYDVERSLKMLSLLGTCGEDCYDAFLQVLRKCNQHGIVKELKKTERFTKFGELASPFSVHVRFEMLSQALRNCNCITIQPNEYIYVCLK